MLNIKVIKYNQLRIIIYVLLVVVFAALIKQNVHFISGQPNLSDSYSLQLFVYHNPLPVALQLFTNNNSVSPFNKLFFLVFLLASWWHVVDLYKDKRAKHPLILQISDIIFLAGLTSNLGELLLFNSVTDYILFHLNGIIIIFNIEDIFLITSLLLALIPNHYLTYMYKSSISR